MDTSKNIQIGDLVYWDCYQHIEPHNPLYSFEKSPNYKYVGIVTKINKELESCIVYWLIKPLKINKRCIHHLRYIHKYFDLPNQQ